MNISPVCVVNNDLHNERIKSFAIIVISRAFLWSNNGYVPSIAPAHSVKHQFVLKLYTTFFKSSPLDHLITSGKSTSTITWQTSFTIWQAVLFRLPNLQARERRSFPVARCQKQMAKRFTTVMDFLNPVSFLRRGSRGNGDRFSMTEGAKAPLSNEGGQVRGHAIPEKRFGLMLLSAISWDFELFGQDIGQVLRLRLGKFTFMFKKLSIFQKSDPFTQNGGNRSGFAPVPLWCIV